MWPKTSSRGSSAGPLLFHARTPVGDTMGRINTDSCACTRCSNTLVFAPGHALLTIGLMVFLMLQLDVTLTLMALAMAPFMVGASFLLGKPLRAAARLKREIESRLQAHIHQTLTAFRRAGLRPGATRTGAVSTAR